MVKHNYSIFNDLNGPYYTGITLTFSCFLYKFYFNCVISVKRSIDNIMCLFNGSLRPLTHHIDINVYQLISNDIISIDI